MRSFAFSLKYSIIFAHTDKSNTSFESVRGLLLFVWIQNHNNTCFLPSRSLWTWAKELKLHVYLPHRNEKYIYRRYLPFKWWTNSNGKQIFSACYTYEMCTSTVEMSVSVVDFITVAQNSENTYKWIIMLIQTSCCFFPWCIHNHYFCQCTVASFVRAL